MRSLEKIKRSLNLAGLGFAFSVFAVVQYQPSVLSQPRYVEAPASDSFLCYMQMNDGQVVNLSSWCANRKPVVSTVTAMSTIDQQFLQRYQSFLEKRATGFPGIQTLIAQAQQNPQSVIQRAQAVCTAIKNGQPQPASGQAGDDLFQTMAPKYFCPELDD